MGRQWLQKKRGINAEKRAKMTSKLAREIMVAAKMGAPDPAFNPRLALAIEGARKQSVSNDVIARAVKKGSGQTGETINFDLVTFEGMSPQNVPVIIECLTDNRNRTAPDMRMLFKDARFGAKVMFFFDHVGIVEATHAEEGLDLETAALEAGADVRTVADLMGHSSTRITQDVYQHVSSERKRDAAERIAERLSQ